MHIALVGCGRTGREIETAAPARGHTIAACYTSRNPLTLERAEELGERRIDCLIDFSHPSAVIEHIRCATRTHIPIVVGTTGWQDRLDEACAIIRAGEGAMVHAANFSPGAALFFRIIREAARLFNHADGYDVSLHEVHHRLKKDVPSGTAAVIARMLIEELDRKRSVRTQASDTASPIGAEELSVTSARVGAVFGTHTVTFSSEADEIELTHRARSRAGFALGALMAAEWVRGRSGIFTSDDVFFG
ncbi:MAG: 4-hydroxy-tetrahydrodipicolinate reductase [Acidobacteriota bacterium]